MQVNRAATNRLAVSLGGTAWELLAQRAAFWVERRWLVIADAHFGKAAAFRARGVPVPQGTTTENLSRLDALIACCGAAAPSSFSATCSTRASPMRRRRSRRSTPGASDTIGSTSSWSRAITIFPRAFRPPGCGFIAKPSPGASARWRSVITRSGCRTRQRWPGICILPSACTAAPTTRVRLPCFWLRDRLTVLPAFGSFTGGACIAREPGERVVALTDDRLFEIPELRSAA